MAGRWTLEAPSGDLVASHVSYGRQPFLATPNMENQVLLTEAVYNLPEVTIRPPKKGLPWWAWAALAAAGGRALRLW